MRPPIIGPCNASPVHRSFAAAASNRPNPFGGVPSGRVSNPRCAKSRWIVRGDGDHPFATVMICAICAAVRPGASSFNVTAKSSTLAAVNGTAVRVAGDNASKPPACHAWIHRSNVLRPIMIRSPLGPACSRPANPRTSTPRSACVNAGSAASRINE